MPSALVLFGEQLRKLRESRGISQEKLAEFSGFRTNQVGRIERAERTVSFEGVIRLAFALSMPPAEIWKLIPTPKRLPKKGEFQGKKDGRTKDK